VGNLQQRAVPLTHIAGLVHEDLLGTPAQRPGAWDTGLNIIASRYRAGTLTPSCRSGSSRSNNGRGWKRRLASLNKYDKLGCGCPYACKDVEPAQ